MDENVTPPMEEPLAQLEQLLIAEYVRAAGEDPNEIRKRDDRSAHKLLADASIFAAARLTEVEARLHYLRRLHGTED